MEKIVSQQKEVIEEFDYSVDQGRPQVHPKLGGKLSSNPLASTQLEIPSRTSGGGQLSDGE